MTCSTRACFVLAAMLAVASLASGSTFKVGEKDGWTSSKNVNYTKWANSIHFQVGDLIRFVYDNKTENVLRVSQHHYASCNVSEPVKKWSSGNDLFDLHKAGHFFFISSVDGKTCQGKAKLNVKVYANDEDAKAPSSANSSSIAHAPAAAKHSTAAGPLLTVNGSVVSSLIVSVVMMIISF